MKSTLLFKTTLDLLLLIVFTSAFIDENTKENQIPYENGVLNGPIEINLPYIKGSKQSDGQLTGQYIQNQKVGVWKLYNKSHKLLVQRNYKNNFEYSIETRTSDNLKLKRDKENLYVYSEVEEKNVGASLRIWRNISPQLMENNPEISMAIANMDLNGIKAFTSCDLRREVKDVDLIMPFSELRIMGDWFYNTQLGRAEYRVLAISPLNNMTKKPPVWFYYPDVRERLQQFPIHTNDSLIQNLDDLFFIGGYPYEVFKIESLDNESFNKQERRKETIKTIERTLILEASLW
jgi:hypothetical protein